MATWSPFLFVATSQKQKRAAKLLPFFKREAVKCYLSNNLNRLPHVDFVVDFDGNSTVR